MPQVHFRMIPLLLFLIVIVGCNDQDERLSELARESLQQQSRQNDALARQNQQISEAARQLVESDAKARQELIAAQQRLQQEIGRERQSLDRQRDDIQQERRELAAARHREPIIAAALVQAALVIVAAIPLLLAVYVFRSLRHDETDAAVGELLVQELTADEPLLLPPPYRPSLPAPPRGALPGPADDPPADNPDPDP